MPSPTPFGRPGDAKKPHERLEAAVVDRLAAMRGPGESYSDVIVRLTPDAGCARGADSTEAVRKLGERSHMAAHSENFRDFSRAAKR